MDERNENNSGFSWFDKAHQPSGLFAKFELNRTIMAVFEKKSHQHGILSHQRTVQRGGHQIL
jgi:hypothetical protein